MIHFAPKIRLLFSLMGVLATCPVVAGDATEKAGVLYGIQTVGDVYQVIAKATTTPTPDISLSGQITIRVPHATQATDTFEAAGISSQVANIKWIESSRVDAPAEAPEYDYLSFSFAEEADALGAFRWQADEEKVLFSFRNPQKCLGDIRLMANTDPFNQLPNSLNTNPGNQFTNLGWGGITANHYLGDLGEAAPCPAAGSASKTNS